LVLFWRLAVRPSSLRLPHGGRKRADRSNYRYACLSAGDPGPAFCLRLGQQPLLGHLATAGGAQACGKQPAGTCGMRPAASPKR